jgi:hypothetical protein
MTYFAHSTMHLYSGEMVTVKGMSPETMYNLNSDIMHRVFEEGLSIMNYELSNLQMMKACYCYLQSKYNPQMVSESDPYSIKN